MSLNNLSDFGIYQEAMVLAGHPQPWDCAEILWDNFCHLDPTTVLAQVRPLTRQVALHVMCSGLGDADDLAFRTSVAAMAPQLRTLKPAYFSDHCCTFRRGGVNLVSAQELDWPRMLDTLCQRVDAYQDALGMPLLLENYASMHHGGMNQPDFMQQVMGRTGCGILFDVSNAVLADLSGVTAFERWLPLLKNRAGLRLHIGGYSMHPTLGVYEDSHAAPISQGSLARLRQVLRTMDVATVCYERSHNLRPQELADDLGALNRVMEEVVHGVGAGTHHATGV